MQLSAARCSWTVALGWFTSLCAMLTWHGALAAPPGQRESAPRVLAAFPLAADDSSWTVRATVRGKKLKMAVDTGASKTTFDVAHRGLLGGVIGTMKINETDGRTPIIRAQVFDAPTIEVGSVKLAPNGALCLDLSFTAMDAGGKADGILGMDLLRRLVFAVDPDELTLRFYSAAGSDLGQRLPVSWGDNLNPRGVPLVSASLINGKSVTFLVDTGGDADAFGGVYSGTLNNATYDRLLTGGAIFAALVNGATIHTISGASDSSQRARAPLLLIGPHLHRDLIFLRFPGPNTLGRGYFARFRATFDFPNNAIYLRPARGYARPDFCDLSGMVIAKKRDKDATVTWVRGDGPAAKAGVVAGDVISTIDGAPAAQFSEFEIRYMLSQSGRRVLGLRRGDAESSVLLLLGNEDATRNRTLKLNILR